MLLLPDALARHRSALESALQEGNIDGALAEAGHLSAGRVADILADASVDPASALLLRLPDDRAGEVLGLMPSPVAADLLQSLGFDGASHLFRTITDITGVTIYLGLSTLLLTQIVG